MLFMCINLTVSVRSSTRDLKKCTGFVNNSSEVKRWLNSYNNKLKANFADTEFHREEEKMLWIDEKKNYISFSGSRLPLIPFDSFMESVRSGSTGILIFRCMLTNLSLLYSAKNCWVSKGLSVNILTQNFCLVFRRTSECVFFLQISRK